MPAESGTDGVPGVMGTFPAEVPLIGEPGSDGVTRMPMFVAGVLFSSCCGLPHLLQKRESLGRFAPQYRQNIVDLHHFLFNSTDSVCINHRMILRCQID